MTFFHGLFGICVHPYCLRSKRNKYGVHCYVHSKNTHGRRGKRNHKRMVKNRLDACAHCGDNYKLTTDHVLSLKFGGKDNVKNYQTLCERCYQFKTTIENRIITSLGMDM